MKKYSLFILSVIISCSVFGQAGEHYVSAYCDCYIGIDPGKAYHKPYTGLFVPTHTEVDSVEMALKITHDSFKNSIYDVGRYVRYYTGFVNEKGHRSIHIWADWKPDEGKSDGEWQVNYDLTTNTFYDFNPVGG